MKFSLAQIRKTYTELLHHDIDKQPYMPVRDWYVLVAIISVCAVLFNIGGHIFMSQDRDVEESGFSSRTLYSLDTDAVHDVARLYEEKETLYLERLSEKVEAEDPAW